LIIFIDILLIEYTRKEQFCWSI